MKICTAPQGTPEWHADRCGLPTASRFKEVMSKGRTKGAMSLTRQSYMAELAGEIMTGIPASSFQSEEMKRGSALEGQAKTDYSMLTGNQVCETGLVMWICEFEWVDFISYDDRMENSGIVVYRQYRDEEYIKSLSEEVEKFAEELAQLVQRLRA